MGCDIVQAIEIAQEAIASAVKPTPDKTGAITGILSLDMTEVNRHARA